MHIHCCDCNCSTEVQCARRQGMNELLAPIALVMSKEYGAESEGDDWVLSLLDPQYMEHDAFAMFSKVRSHVLLQRLTCTAR